MGSNISWPPYPIEVKTDLGEGYILYVRSNYLFTNDEYAIVLKSNGELLFFTNKQFKVVKNHTYQINIQ